jgi:hypothetical protein
VKPQNINTTIKRDEKEKRGVGFESWSKTNFFIGPDSQSFKLEDNQNSAEHFLQIRGRLKHFQSATAKKPTLPPNTHTN